MSCGFTFLDLTRAHHALYFQIQIFEVCLQSADFNAQWFGFSELVMTSLAHNIIKEKTSTLFSIVLILVQLDHYQRWLSSCRQLNQTVNKLNPVAQPSQPQQQWHMPKLYKYRCSFKGAASRPCTFWRAVARCSYLRNSCSKCHIIKAAVEALARIV